MSRFVKKTPPPPDIKEGDVVPATIISISKTTSQYKDPDGSDRVQLEFRCELANGFPARAWTAFYQRPRDKSVLGKLALTFESQTQKQAIDMDDFLKKLSNYGQIYLKCKGFRERDGKLYPNFAIYPDKIPVVDTTAQAKIQ